MTNSEKIFTSLCCVFSVLVVMGNLIYQKFVFLPIFSLHVFELSVGAILYPLTFLLTDLITEFYGKDKANFCVKLGLCMNIFVAIVICFMNNLNATDWSKIDNATFNLVFGMYSVSFISSIVACYISQTVDINLYLWILKLTKGRFLWLRNNGSTAISLFIDTITVISILTFFEILPYDKMWLLIFNSYLFKFFFTACNTPLFYLYVWIIRKLLKAPRN